MAPTRQSIWSSESGRYASESYRIKVPKPIFAMRRRPSGLALCGSWHLTLGPLWENPLLNPDFRDMLSALCDEGVEFMLVGAYALAVHGYPRATGDMDIWIRPSDDNARRVWRALKRFKAPMSDLTVEDLTTPDIVFQIGVAPRRIDMLTSIDGVDFDEAWPHRKHVDVEGQQFAVIGRSHLLRNKKATGRAKDLADVAWLESEQTE
jgi:hypothetical protein